MTTPLADLIPQLTDSTGVWSVRRLSRLGIGVNERKRLLRANRIMPLRRGWYAAHDAHPAVVAAVRSGGVLSCSSAAELATKRQLQRPMQVSATRPGMLKMSAGLQECALGRRLEQYLEPCPGTGVDSVWNSALHLMKCRQSVEAEVNLELLLHHGLLSRYQLERLHEVANTRQSRRLNHLTGKCESYIEALLKIHLRKASIPFTQQVWIDELMIRNDFKIGESMLIECDGRKYHGSYASFESDRVRDSILIQRGYVVLRFSAAQIIHEPGECIATVRAEMKRGSHRRRLH